MSIDTVGGDRAAGMTATSRPLAFTSNHAQRGAVAQRAEERRDQIAALLRAALAPAARVIQVEVPPAERTDFESQTLRDCIRDRRNASPETLVTLLDIQVRRTESRHALSEAIRAVELSMSPAFLISVEDAIDAEQEADALCDAAELKAREKSPTRIQAVRETALRHIARLRDLADSCSWTLARRAR